MLRNNMFVLIKKAKKAEKESMFLLWLHRLWVSGGVRLLGEVRYTKAKYHVRVGKNLNLEDPKGLTEKIQWLKLNYYLPYYKESCDKYYIHSFMEKYLGIDLCPELLYSTNNTEDFSLNKISHFPCIVKISNGSGQNLILHSKEEYTDSYLKKKLKRMIYDANTHSKYGCEKQYLKSKPYIVVERLLLDESGKLPDDYKFFFMNGKLVFIYCSVDRLGKNVRHLYDSEWNRINALLLQNASDEKYRISIETPSIPKPEKFQEMKEIGAKISKFFPLVRVDYYEVNSRVYIGELTLHHGGGFDRFYPDEYDDKFGSELTLPVRNC